MRSAWWWNTKQWAEYQAAYYAGRERPEEYKSSPLADDHDFDWTDENRKLYQLNVHQTQVIDLTVSMEQLWRGVRKSYQSLINKGFRTYDVEISDDILAYQHLHALANGVQPRPDETYAQQGNWLASRNGLLVMADIPGVERYVAAAYWILYCDEAYYASGPSIEKNVQHAVIWKSLELLKAMGVRLAELGDIGWRTTKEEGISKFKRGFGGYAVPFTVVTRRAS